MPGRSAIPMGPPRLLRRISVLAAAALVLVSACPLFMGHAVAQNSPEELVLTVARARMLANQALEDGVTPIGAMLVQLGPSTTYAAGSQGFGGWSLSAGGVAASFDITNPDYELSDPTGSDRIEGGIGAFYGDLSLGLYKGYDSGESHSILSADLLLRLGFTLGDQDDLDNEIDLGSLAPIFGAGLRLGVIKGEKLPSISISGGISFFQNRTFKVQGEVEEGGQTAPFEVELEMQQTSAFVLLEVGKQFGWITPYLAGGLGNHRLEARYSAEVIYDIDAEPVQAGDDLDLLKTQGVAFGGAELGSGLFRFVLQLGISGDETFGTFFLRFTGG